MKNIEGGVNAPIGFSTFAANAGIRKQRDDLAMIYSNYPLGHASVFTTNLVQAAPVKWNKALLDENQPIHAVVVNSGNANAVTGEMGIKHVEMTADTVAKLLDVPNKSVLVASTGVIGVPLPIDKIVKGIEDNVKNLSGSSESAQAAAEAIRTTDTCTKQIAIEIELGGIPVRIGAMAKGSGMIHPNMATMLAFITSDVDISTSLLLPMLKEITDKTFNMISVDGDTSTNDQVSFLTSKQAGNVTIETSDSPEYKEYWQALFHVCRYIAREIARDGEGATKLITANVLGAKTENDARKMAKSIISSNLVKSAIFGEDANWGRILCAMGYSGAEFNPEKVSVSFSNQDKVVSLLEKGQPVIFDETIASEILGDSEILVNAYLEDGSASASAWGCDLSYDYVKINACYRT